MRNAVLWLILATLLGGCPHDDLEGLNPRLHPIPAPAKDYFPFVKGARWTYVSSDTQLNSTSSILMTDVAASGDLIVANVEETVFNRQAAPDTWHYRYTKSAGEITSTLVNEAFSSIKPEKLVYFPLIVGRRTLAPATHSIDVNNGTEWHYSQGETLLTIESTSSTWSDDCISSTQAFDWVTASAIATISQTFSKTMILAPNIGPIWIYTNFGGVDGAVKIASFSIPVLTEAR